MTPPQPDHFSTQAKLSHNMSLVLLTLGLSVLPLMICALVFGQSGGTTTEQQ